MNERQFLRAINHKSNLYGELTYSQVYKMLENSNNEISIIEKNNVFSRLLKKYRKVKTPKQIIEDNFEHILNRTNDNNIASLLILLIYNSETESVVENKFDIILDRFKNGPAYKSYSIEGLCFAQNEFFTEFMNYPDADKIIQNNIEGILKSTRKDNLFSVAQIISNRSKQIDDKLNNCLEENKIEIAKSLLKKYTKVSAIELLDDEIRDQLADEYAITLSIMIDELLENEKCRMIDIKTIGNGSYSNVYAIGNKVLKIGGARETYEIPNHARILQPLTRTNLNDEKNNTIFSCIEIMDKVDKLNKEDIKEDELYQIYKELRESGIIWTDSKFSNVGKLNKRNSPYQTLNGEVVNVAPNSVGFINEMEGEATKEQDIVIIDTDYIYTENATNITWPNNALSGTFEKRWQQEQQAKIANEHKEEIVEQNINEKGEEDERK